MSTSWPVNRLDVCSVESFWWKLKNSPSMTRDYPTKLIWEQQKETDGAKVMKNTVCHGPVMDWQLGQGLKPPLRQHSD